MSLESVELWYLDLYGQEVQQRPASNRHGAIGTLVSVLLTVQTIHKSRISTAWEPPLVSPRGKHHYSQGSETSPIQDGGNGHHLAQQPPLRIRAP